MFRRSAVLDAGNYRDVGPVNIEDYDLWMRMAVHHRLANLKEPLLHYRIHDKSATQISLAQNRLQAALDTRFCEHAPALFGCSSEDAQKLRTRAHPHTNRVLREIAQYRAQIDNVPVEQVLHSETFCAAARELTRHEDIVSRLKIASLCKRKSILTREIVMAGKVLIKNTWVGRIRANVRRLRKQRKEKRLRSRWFKAMRAQNCEIDTSLWVIGGQPNPYSLLHIGNKCKMEADTTLWISADAGAEPRLELDYNVFIGRNTYLGVYQSVHIGSNTVIGAYSLHHFGQSSVRESANTNSRSRFCWRAHCHRGRCMDWNSCCRSAGSNDRQRRDCSSRQYRQ